MKEVKKINERYVDPDKRVARLIAICHEHGPEKLLAEFMAHSRKMLDIEAALEQYRKEIN